MSTPDWLARLPGPPLPIAAHLDRIAEALADAGALVALAQPGAGKTTVVPPALLEAPFLRGRRIVMLEPRRIAAVAAAARIAELLGERLGATAGYAVRHERRTSAATRIEVVTEGLLARRLLDDPGLEDTGLVILDEFHERSVHADLALALLLEAREMRPDLRLLLMSATLDARRVAAFVGCPVLEVPGRAFEVETRHGEGALLALDPAAVAETALRALGETGGDVLVFLAGAREMRLVEADLARSGTLQADVVRLHGMMPLASQRAVTTPRPGGRPRIVLATNVAETSLTVPGVRAVVDSGFARLSRFHPRSGMNRLVTERVSSQAADQRRGRAGRLGPGLCIRCWDSRESLPAETPPEILRSELSATVLAAALWGARKSGDLRFLDPPPPALWESAAELLRGLGAIDAGGAPTERGRALARTGLPPRLGAVIEEGRAGGCVELACACAAVLAARDSTDTGEDADFGLRLGELQDAMRARPPGEPAPARAREYAHLLSVASRGAARVRPCSDDQAGALLLAGFPDRLAQRVDRGLFRLVSGRVARLRGALAEETFVVAVEADAGETTGTIFAAAAVSRDVVQQRLAPLIQEEQEISWKGWVPVARAVRRIGVIVLGSDPVPRPDRAALGEAVARRVHEQGLAALPWSQSSARLLARLRFAERSASVAGPSGVARPPGWSDQELAGGVGEWLEPFLRHGAGPVIDEAALHRALRARVPPARAAALDREAPESLVLPTGSRRHIEYGDGLPSVEARVQELFGLAASPIICGKPLVFRLLSPAGRPLQVTGDLASFWRETYPQVLRSMRARYPKHAWPDDPLAARPTAGTRPRRRG